LTRQQIGWLMQNQKQQLAAKLAQQQYVGQGYGQQQQQAYQTGSFAAQGTPPPPPSYGGQQGYPQQSPNMPPPPPGFGGQQQVGFGAQGMQGMPPPPPGYGGQQQNYPPPQQAGYGAQGMPQQTGGYPQQNQGDTGAFNTQSSKTQNQRLTGGYVQSKPPVSSSTQEYFLPTILTAQQAFAMYEQQTGQRVPSGGQDILAYKAVLFAQTSVRYQQKKAQIYTSRDYAFHIPDLDTRGLVNWEEYQASLVDSRQLSGEAFGQAVFQELPLGLQDEKRLKTLEKELVDFLYNTARMIIPQHPQFKLYGDPDTDISQFQAEVYQRAREERDKEIDKLSDRYAGLMDRLEDKLRKKNREYKSEQMEIGDRKKEQLYTTGEALFSLMKGRTNYTLSRMSRASRYKKQTEHDIEESREVIAEIERDMYDIEQEYEQKLNEVNDRWAQIANNIEEHTITPYKKDIHLVVFGVGWVPHYYVNAGGEPLVVPAFA
jgi:hypothetical protein